MKRTITSIMAIGLFAVATFAQLNVEIKDGDGNIQNEGTYVVYGDPSTSTMHLDLFTENLNVSNMVVNVKRYETSVQAGTKNFFCWGVCYGAIDAGTTPLWISTDVVDMQTDSIYPNFHAYHQPQNLEGVSCYRYVWYDNANTDDSTWVDVCFDTQTVGIEENGVVSELNVYPNPSLGDVNFDITVVPTAVNAELVIYNILGEQVWSSALKAEHQRVVLSRGELNSGVYFYSIISNGTITTTERLIIADR